MANTIKIKNSGTASNTPSAASLAYGELALNYIDGKLYFKNGASTTDYFRTGGAKLTSSDTAPSSPSAGDIWYETDSGKTFVYYDSFWVEVGGSTTSIVSGGAVGFWGSFWSTQDQTAAAANTAYSITYNNTDPDSNGVSIVSNSRVTFANAGVYSLTFSVQWVNAGAQIYDANIWFAKNGTNIADSDSKWSVVESHGGVDGHAIGTVNYVLKLAAGDYIELKWQVTDTNVSLQYEPAVSPAPAIPSIILTAQQVMNTQVGTSVAELLGGSTINSNVTGSSLTSVGTLSSLRVSGGTNIGSNTFLKTTLGSGEVALDNGTTDTPGLLLYTANNKNWGIDSYNNGSSQLLRFVRDLNESGGTTKASLDTNGNFNTSGYLDPNAWKPGQVIKDTMLSNTEMTVVSTTIAATGSNVDFITYSYTPVSSSSYLLIHFHCSRYQPAGTVDDSWYSVLKAAGNEIAYGWQKVNDDGNGTSGRSGVLFPLMGRYTNSSTNAVTIAVAARRDTADDSITIDNSATALWLRITEVAR